MHEMGVIVFSKNRCLWGGLHWEKQYNTMFRMIFTYDIFSRRLAAFGETLLGKPKGVMLSLLFHFILFLQINLVAKDQTTYH